MPEVSFICPSFINHRFPPPFYVASSPSFDFPNFAFDGSLPHHLSYSNELQPFFNPPTFLPCFAAPVVAMPNPIPQGILERYRSDSIQSTDSPGHATGQGSYLPQQHGTRFTFNEFKKSLSQSSGQSSPSSSCDVFSDSECYDEGFGETSDSFWRTLSSRLSHRRTTSDSEEDDLQFTIFVEQAKHQEPALKDEEILDELIVFTITNPDSYEVDESLY